MIVLSLKAFLYLYCDIQNEKLFVEYIIILFVVCLVLFDVPIHVIYLS